ncbi:MAG: hypothetical protein Q9166_003072 [cf. Caloplaca sp. 2 TL-2023]
MPSLTDMLTRSRSKSEKLTTPPKIVYGDLNAAYKSIAQRGSPSTPDGSQNLHRHLSTHVEINTACSPVHSPQSDASPSVALMGHRSPDAIRVGHLSGDLYLPKDFDSPEPRLKSPETWDPFANPGHNRTSINTPDFKKHVLEGYFGVTPSDNGDVNQSQNKNSPDAKLLSASDYPELKDSQLEACSKISGAENHENDTGKELERCGAIQSVVSRHHYGRVDTNEDIHSVQGSHGEGEGPKDSENAQDDEVEQVEWTPRSSVEVPAISNVSAQRRQHPGSPPSVALPQTPKGKEITRYRLKDPLSPTEQTSHSSESYGDTQRLLQLSLPQLPEAPVSRNNLYRQLVQFAREGPSSSSHGGSSKSFAEFTIEQAHGGQITRPVSQGEFQELERTISSHLCRESRMSNATDGAGLVNFGQISLRFPKPSSGADLGPGSSQTASSRSEVEVDWDTGSVQGPLRTRNGTPPLLFRSIGRVKNDADWETVGDSNDMTSSIADVSDSASRSPPKSFLTMHPGRVLRHPAHPRYNHSWDLQQDMRSGSFVLTPRYEHRPGGSSFPNQNAMEPLSIRNYSHPTPLTGGHSHPFAAPPVQITPQSQGSSAWLSTSPSTPVPPVPMRNPSRPLHQLIPDHMSALEEGSVSQAASDVPGSSNGRSATDTSKAILPFPQSTFSPRRHCRVNDIELQAMISPVARPANPRAPAHTVPRLWVPTPHPLAHLGPREESPHLWYAHPISRRPSHQQVVSRYYLIACAFLPLLLAPYCLGCLDWVMRVHTRGLYREMRRYEKNMAALILLVEVLGAAAFVPFVFSLL